MKPILKNITTSLILGVTSIFANEDYEEVVENFRDNKFKNSYLAIKDYLKTYPMDKNIAFMLGRSAYQIGKFDEALEIYNKLLQEDSTNNRVKLELAQTYFQLGKFDKARILYEEVLKDNTLPSNVKNNIEITLNFLENKAKKNTLKTTLSFGYGYDSNIENISRANYVYLWNILPLRLEDKKSDHFSEYMLALNHTYKLKDNITIDNKIIGFKQMYNNHTENDIDLAIFGTGISYYGQKYKLSLGFDVNLVWLDDSSYLNNYILSPSFEYKLTDRLLYKIKASVVKKDFKQSQYEFRDSTYYELQNSLRYISEDFGVNTIIFTFGNDNKDDGTHYDVDYDFISLRYENMYPITNSTILVNGVEAYRDIYRENENFLYGDKRQNEKYMYNLGVIQSINKDLSFGVTFRYVNDNSNQELYEYDKYTVKTNLYYSF